MSSMCKPQCLGCREKKHKYEYAFAASWDLLQKPIITPIASRH